MDAEGTDATTGPMVILKKLQMTMSQRIAKIEGSAVPVLVATDAIVLSGFGGEVEGNRALWLGSCVDC